jgi:hypothetical protein
MLSDESDRGRTMNAKQIRCENDIKIEQNLLEDSMVKRIKEQVDQLTEKGPLGVRRQLLSSSVRLSRSMSPAVHNMAEHCIEKLGVDPDSCRMAAWVEQNWNCMFRAFWA